MQSIWAIAAKFSKIGPVPFFVGGAFLLMAGAFLQVTQVMVLPEIGNAATTFGIFAKLGGAVILFGLLMLALETDGSDEPDRHIPDDVPQSARTSESPA